MLHVIIQQAKTDISVQK